MSVVARAYRNSRLHAVCQRLATRVHHIEAAYDRSLCAHANRRFLSVAEQSGLARTSRRFLVGLWQSRTWHWLTDAPPSHPITIDLTETRTVGTLLRLLDGDRRERR